MWAISWQITMARRSWSASVAGERNSISSRNTTQPGFSIAPQLNSGTKAWWYSPNG